MSAHDTSRTLAAYWRKKRLAVLHFDKMPLAQAAQSSRRRLIGKNGKTAGRSSCLQRFEIRRLAFFAANPDLFQKVIEPNLVVG